MRERHALLPVKILYGLTAKLTLTSKLVNPEVIRKTHTFVFNFQIWEEEEEACSVIMTCEMQDEVN